ncbi:hypothetical protein [Blastococcus saxobsidens]|uniref:Uncharacterized protein n=1 Tax=Blastococcus saxobsidens (strain DD2) TaxID=1146883 RepID=H6RIM4_BLASD|nr:hypothetical protein [Blastococcus saxobsidens]CCG02218.1 membrane protein of unknown function [Blastococcus saxobsidens DD2]
MTTPPRIDPHPVPSLDVVESALVRVEGSYRTRASSLDTKNGLVLAAAGVLVALVGARPEIAGLIGQVIAVAAGAAAVRSLGLRVDKAIDVGLLRDRYLGVDPTTARLVLLNTRIDLQARDEQQLLVKLRFLRLAAALRLGASVAILVGAIVNLI